MPKKADFIRLFFQTIKIFTMRINKRVWMNPPRRTGSIKNIIHAQRNSTVGKSAVGTPQYPGAASGLTQSQSRQLIREQPRVTGIPFVASAGSFTINNIEIPGDATLFLGLMFTPTGNAMDTFTMAINNNKIIDNGSVKLHSPDNSQSIKSQYFPYMQPLTGKDVLAFQLQTTSGLTGVLQLHYI